MLSVDLTNRDEMLTQASTFIKQEKPWGCRTVLSETIVKRRSVLVSHISAHMKRAG